MKDTMKRLGLLMVLLLACGSALAAGKEDLPPYLKIQEALANDSLKDAKEAATGWARATKDKRLSGPAKSLAQASDIEAARTQFKELSVEMDKWAVAAKPSGIDRVNCPMAEASWLQKHGPVMNPYYGKQMQSCGDVR